MENRAIGFGSSDRHELRTIWTWAVAAGGTVASVAINHLATATRVRGLPSIPDLLDRDARVIIGPRRRVCPIPSANVSIQGISLTGKVRRHARSRVLRLLA